MAKKKNQLGEGHSKLGHLIKIVNMAPRPEEPATYNAVWVVDQNGNEFCLFLTDDMIAQAKLNSLRNPEDRPEKEGFLHFVD